MKKIALALIAALLIPAAAFAAGKEIKIGVTPFPHKDIMNVVKQLLAKDGYELKIVEFTDYVTPNTALAEKSLDANFFQHIPYLENTVKEKGLKLVWVAKIHIEPLGLYSKKIGKLGELKNGAQIAIPNDATNCARALRLLEKGGLVKVKAGELVTAKDVTDNPKNFKIRELDAAQLPRTLQDVDAAVINTNFAVEAGLIPAKDAIIIEGKDSPYANVVAVRAEEKDSPAIKALVKASNSKEVKDFINKELVPKGIGPAF
ncbi:MetQ/NlpA family ABC transporter substrate-binding protein [Synergistes jonesii]|uniref:MetQ/NlpA family ABC transporter substrate-binding protein n=1 Tax=Synergistes jonesii TaxID=2754 RepID=UPI00242E2EFA|nr:MetQ/NlpA family ABC transporter substrate-binding protein [Synergistes jonesii]